MIPAPREIVGRCLRFDPAGGIIAQFEFVPGIVPDNATLVFEQWEFIALNHGKTIF